MGLLAKISKLIIDLDRDSTAHHLVSLILDELLDVLVPVDPTAVVWSHHDQSLYNRLFLPDTTNQLFLSGRGDYCD